MAEKIISDNTILIKKNSTSFDNIEAHLQQKCGGKIIRYAIVGVADDFYKVSYSYKVFCR